MPSKGVTMREVADRAGVAISTVSRVLSDPYRSSPQTRETVLQAVRELGYPMPADNLAWAVAVEIPGITSPFYFGLVRGAQERLRAAGFGQILIQGRPADLDTAPELSNRSIAGAILFSPRSSDAALQALADRIPVVIVNREVAGLATVLLDSNAAVQHAVEHLVSLGHRRICYVSGPHPSWANETRWQACAAAGERLGVEAVRIGPFVSAVEVGGAATDSMINTGATAAIAFNDMLAIGMLQRFAARGISVPGQVSIVGCDDMFGASFCHPPLTTLAMPMVKAGQAATELLLGQLADETDTIPRPVRLPARLIIRSSTGPAA